MARLVSDKDARSFLELLSKGSNRVVFQEPITIRHYELGVVTVTFAERKSDKGRFRLFQFPGSKPLEISHCVGVIDAFQHLANLHFEERERQQNEEVYHQAEEILGVDVIALVHKMGFPESSSLYEKAYDLASVCSTKNVREESIPRLKAAIELVVNLRSREELFDKYHDMDLDTYKNLTPYEKVQYWVVRQYPSFNEDFNLMRDLWYDAKRFNSKVPVIYDAWFKTPEQVKAVTEELLKTEDDTLIFASNSSSALNAICMFINEGWVVDKVVVLKRDYSQDNALVLTHTLGV